MRPNTDIHVHPYIDALDKKYINSFFACVRIGDVGRGATRRRALQARREGQGYVCGKFHQDVFASLKWFEAATTDRPTDCAGGEWDLFYDVQPECRS